MKVLSALQPPRLTSAQIAALPAGTGRFTPGSVVFDTTLNLLRTNVGTDAAQSWVHLTPADLAYVEFPFKNSTNHDENVLDLVVATPSITLDGSTPIWVEFFALGYVNATNLGSVQYLHLWRSFNGGADAKITRLWRSINDSTGTPESLGTLRIRLAALAAGSYVFKIGIASNAGTAQLLAGDGSVASESPGYLRVYRA